MLHFSRTKVFFILAAVFIGLLFALPNAVGDAGRKTLDSFRLPSNTINLGLDLQGGAHLLLEVDLKDGLDQALKNERSGISQAFREAQIGSNTRVEGDFVSVVFRSEADEEEGLPILQAQSINVDDQAIGGGGKTLVIEENGDLRYKVTISEEYIEYLAARTIDQSIQVLRRRIDPTGTLEMTLAKEGDDRILLQVPGVDNEKVAEIKDRIKKTAKLSFHENVPADPVVMDLCLNQKRCLNGQNAYLFKDGGGALILNDRAIVTGADLKKAAEGLHPTNGSPIVNFTYNAKGSRKFCDYTSDNEGELFAVLLDSEIITAPRINGAICGGSGYIEGNFTMESARELSLLLNAGALPAKLRIAQESTVGPDLGADSIRAGKIASIIGLIGVAFFMWISYGFRFGTFANIALGTNIILIAGGLSILGATLTLPGIAGIILTIGMAVLIFERIREEEAQGRGPINAIDTGYRRSLAPILDANITTLIAALTLYFVGSGPIRGFAVTLAIGIVMSVFTAVVFARLITSAWLRRARPKKLPI